MIMWRFTSFSFVLPLPVCVCANFLTQVVRSPPRHDVLPSNFVEGSYVTPVTFKRGDLYARGWLLDWWHHICPTRSGDDLVEFLARDYCSEFRTFGYSCTRFVRDS
jgi:hypothetical protein